MLFIPVLRKAFDGFDHNRSGSIPCDFVADILRMMGQPFNKKILEELIEEVDADSKYYSVNFILFTSKNCFVTIISNIANLFSWELFISDSWSKISKKLF